MTPTDLTTARKIAAQVARHYARKYNTDPADFEQDGLVYLLASLDKYNPARSSWRTFCRLYLRAGIARAGAKRGRTIRVPEYAQFTARQRGERLPDDTISIDLPDENGNAMQFPTDAVGADELIDRARLRTLVARLPARQRAVVELCDLHGLSSSEAGAMLGISRQAVHVHITEAYRSLRAMIEAQPRPDPPPVCAPVPRSATRPEPPQAPQPTKPSERRQPPPIPRWTRDQVGDMLASDAAGIPIDEIAAAFRAPVEAVQQIIAL